MQRYSKEFREEAISLSVLASGDYNHYESGENRQN